jgi:ABC-type sugar transport system permease subunit
VLNYLIYIEAFGRLNLGVASAMSMLLTLLIIMLSGLSLLFVMRGRQR